MNRMTRLLGALLLFSVLAACGSPAAPAALSPSASGRLPVSGEAPLGDRAHPTVGAPAGEPQPLTGANPTAVPAATVPAPSGWPSELFFARPEGARGALIAYDMADGSQRFRLPGGMMSADGQHYYAVNTDEDGTGLEAFDPQTGYLLNRFDLEGPWALSGVSPTGRWLALTRVPGADEKQAWTEANQWETGVEIVDADNGRVEHILNLDGNFEVETISADGKSLFLVQHLPAVNPDHYVIRLYDLSAEKLVADPLRSKASDEVMAGLAWEGVGTPNGRWLLTLYLSTRRNVAFIHTLNLNDKVPVCIDLPSGGGDFDQLKHYTLALAPGGNRVYAVNPAMGVVAEVSLNTLRVTRQVYFEAGAPDRAAYDPHAPTARSVISRDGQMLYFTSGKEVWAYDTKLGKVSGPYVTHKPITGLGLSGDGRRLYVASGDQASLRSAQGSAQELIVFDTASGRRLSFPARVQ